MIMTAKEYLDYGNGLVKQGQLDDAMIAFGHAIQEEPAYAKAYNNLGMLFRIKNQLPEAEALLQRALELEPEDSAGYNNLGLIYLDMYNLIAAELCLNEAIRLNSKCAQFYNNLGLVYDENNNIECAEKAYRKAISLQNDYADAYLNLGILLKSIHRFTEAELCLKQAAEIRCGYPQAVFALASLYLLQGWYKAGWELYEMFRLNKIKKRFHNLPLWQGEALKNSRIVLFFEQGFGDTLQFVRYLDQISEFANEVVLWAQPQLKSLFAFSFPKITIYDDANVLEEEYDFISSLMSLPKIFNTSADCIPSNVPYIKTSEAIEKKWRERVNSITSGQKKIGIVWAGNPKHPNDRNRSIPFDVFQRIFAVDGVSWFNLQVGKKTEDLKAVTEVTDYSAELTDFSQTAGLIACLDLVITVDTAVAHLAGAMGKVTWNLQPYLPDWRWQLQRTDSPWYPTMRLFRQESRGDWAGVIEKVIGEVKTII